MKSRPGEEEDTYQVIIIIVVVVVIITIIIIIISDPQAGYLPDAIRSSKAREAEGCDGVYSWLETLPRSEGEGSSGASGGPESPTVTEGDSVSEASPAEMELSASNAELIHGYENFDANAEAGAAPMPEKYASEIFNRSKQYFSVRGVSGSIVEALGDPETSSVRNIGNSYISMRPPWDPVSSSRGTSREPFPETKREFLQVGVQHPFLAPQQRRKRHESVV